MIELLTEDYVVGEKICTFEFARRGPGARIIIEDLEGRILITKEYRAELNTYDYRIPGGKVFDSLEQYEKARKSKDTIESYAFDAIKKEAEEEAGVIVHELNYFCVSHCGATMIWDLYYFYTKKWEFSKCGQKLEIGENIEVNWFDSDQVIRYCLEGQITEERSAISLLKYFNIIKKRS
jgi:ADP-ribose pyrophosphatase